MSLKSAVPLLKNGNFVNLLLFRVLIVFSYQIVAVVVGWHIYQITHNAFSLGLIGLAEVIPFISTALFAGYAIDHYSRRMFGVFASLILMLNALTLSAIAHGYIGSNSSTWIYCSIACVGMARAFIGPTYSSLFALVLKREEFGRAASIGSSVLQAGLVLGPALGGLLVAYTSISIAYLVAAAFGAAAGLALFCLKIAMPAPAKHSPIFTSIGQGLRFVAGNQIVLGAQALDMFAVLFGGAVAMLPAFIHDIYHYGAEGLGILRAAPALGAICMGLLLTRFPINKNAGRILLMAVAGFGVCIILFALTSHFWVAGLLLVFSGACDGVSVVVRTTIMQLMTPDNMRGRVSAINGIFIGSSNEFGAFESGLSAKLLGLIPSVVFGGAMTLAVVGITARLAPKLRNVHLQDLQ